MEFHPLFFEKFRQTFLQKLEWKKIAWPNVTHLSVTLLATIILVPYYFYREPLNGWILLFAFLYSFATLFSITGGYHRLFAHVSYQAHSLLRFFYLVVGAAAFQGSALKWATDHRRHHRRVDTTDDPYNIKQGFFYAHMGWLMVEDNPEFQNQFASDLHKDKAVWLQHKYYLPIAFVMAYLFPTVIGAFLGSALGGFVLAGVLRVVLTNHSTFFINSLCHMVGRQPYTDENTARDSFIMAIFACGEGYHNFHHKFQSDYRNGIRWYHWDPTKWGVAMLSFVGFTRGLRRTSASQILKARLTMDEKRLIQIGIPAENLHPFRIKVEEAQQRWRLLKEDYAQLKVDVRLRSQERLGKLRAEIRRAKRESHSAWDLWIAYTKHLRVAYSPA